MSLSSTNNRDDYTGNGTTANYAYTFRIYANTDINVYVVTTATGVETTLTVDVDYTVNNIGATVGTIDLLDASQDWIDGSSFLDTGYTLAIVRDLPFTQPTEFRNQGTFYPQTHEDAIDRIAMLCQQLKESDNRTLTFSEAVDIGSFDATIPAGLGVVAGAGKLLVVNDTGTGFDEGPTAGNIAAAEANAIAAAASAAAALASETATAAGSSKYVQYANDAAYVTGKGSAAADGDSYYNTTTDHIRLYENGAWVNQSIVATKGDIAAFSTAPIALAVGDNDKVLTADSSEATGLKWGVSIRDSINMMAFKNFPQTTAAPSAKAWTHIVSNGTWFYALAPSGTTNFMQSVAYGKAWTAPAASLNFVYTDMIYSSVASLILACASGTATGISSYDFAWTARTTPNKTWVALCENSTLIVAVNSNGSGGDGAMYSTNGTSWTGSTACQNEAWTDIASDGTIFVAVGGTGYAGKVSTSTDGDTWTARTPAHTSTDFKRVVWDSRNSQFLALGVSAGSGDWFMTSPDGITWTDATTSNVQISKIIHTGSTGIYVAILTGGAIVATSVDGVSWEIAAVKQQGTWVDLASSIHGVVLISDDATGDRICNSLTGSVDF